MGQRIMQLDARGFVRMHMTSTPVGWIVRPAPGCELPADVRVLRMGHDHVGWIYLVLESAEWSGPAEGDEIQPIRMPTLAVVNGYIAGGGTIDVVAGQLHYVDAYGQTFRLVPTGDPSMPLQILTVAKSAHNHHD